jgi:hypothetical protein
MWPAALPLCRVMYVVCRRSAGVILHHWSSGPVVMPALHCTLHASRRPPLYCILVSNLFDFP